MAISNHHALSEATCISRAWRFKSSLGHPLKPLVRAGLTRGFAIRMQDMCKIARRSGARRHASVAASGTTPMDVACCQASK